MEPDYGHGEARGNVGANLVAAVEVAGFTAPRTSEASQGNIGAGTAAHPPC